MGPEGAANIVFRKEIAEAEDPEAMRKQKIEEYKEKFANPYVAAARGYIDEVIEPQETGRYCYMPYRFQQIRLMPVLRKRHGIPPF